jgi:hypothetical protein
VDIANQLEQVRLFLAQDGLVTVLEKIPVTLMAAVERRRVSGQQAPHDRRQRNAAGAEQQVHMVGKQCPGVTRGPRRPENISYPIEESGAVHFIANDRLPLDPPKNDMVQGTWSIKARVTRHGDVHTTKKVENNALFHDRP